MHKGKKTSKRIYLFFRDFQFGKWRFAKKKNKKLTIFDSDLGLNLIYKILNKI